MKNLLGNLACPVFEGTKVELSNPDKILAECECPLNHETKNELGLVGKHTYIQLHGVIHFRDSPHGDWRKLSLKEFGAVVGEQKAQQLINLSGTELSLAWETMGEK